MMPLKRLRALFSPEQFQGWGITRKYFEGWYFKVVNASGTKAFAFIPGIAMDKTGKSHAFIQVLDGIAKKSWYHNFETSLFVPSAGKFDLAIDTNHFSSDSITLDLPSIKGSLRFTDIVRWPDKWYSPGIMGPYTFAPFMECNHGIVSMDHAIEGSLEINGQIIDFTGGRGYTEKDWGHSFPLAYVWMQSNNFEATGISFKASVARVPWLTGAFTGFIAGLWFANRLYSFTTYNKSNLKSMSVSDSVAEMEFGNHYYRLEARALRDKSTPLASPLRGLMDGRIEESMTCEVSIVLTDRKNERIIFSGTGRNSSIEVSGPVETLYPR